jgi:glycosyltransferase involved in cell wall biosynthesis
VKIVFDAYWWVAGPPSLRHVMREIVGAWSRNFPADEITLVVRKKHAKLASVEMPPNASLVPSGMYPQALLASYATARVAKSLGADAIVAQNFAARSDSLSTVYLHDVLFMTNPEWFTRTERLYFSFMNRFSKRADLVFTSTETEGDRVRRLTSARKVLPVGLGLSRELMDGIAMNPVIGLNQDSFVLTVGRLNIRKNLSRVIRAALDTGQITPSHPLVIVGSPNGKAGETNPEVEAAIESGAVVFTGFVDEATLRWLYSNTSLFVFLSLGEGFGMPPVEASYFGAPVLASDLPVFRETLRSRAHFVDPTEVADIRQGIIAALERGAPLELLDKIEDTHNWDTTVQLMRDAMMQEIGSK